MKETVVRPFAPFLVFCVLAAARPGAADILHVPSEYGSITAALAAAQAPDTVLVACGTYVEHGLVLNPGVTLSGEPGSTCGIIDGTGSAQGILLLTGGDPGTSVRWLTFRNGQATDGGAIRVASGHPAPGPLIEHCRFEENTASYGGAVNTPGGPVRVDSCEFLLNSANESGGALWAYAPTVTGSTFLQNSAHGPGGGAIFSTQGEIASCRFEGNSATSVVAGAGGAVNAGSTYLHDSVFRLNMARSGGGARSAGLVERCVFEANTATSTGGGLETTGAQARALHCRFVENEAALAGGLSTGSVAESCTFLRNGGSSAVAGGTVLRHVVIQGSPAGRAYAGFGSVVNSDFHGNAGGDWIGAAATHKDLNGNFSADGLFCDAPAESLGVSPFSPLLAAHTATGVAIGAESVGCAAEGMAVLTAPAGLTVVVDGTPVTTPAIFPWAPGTLHVVEAPVAVETGTGVRFDFLEWSDGGAPVHTVTAGSEPGSWIARYGTTYRVTMEADEHGTTVPQTGWFAPGIQLSIRAVADSLYLPTGWTGTGPGSYTGPSSVARFELLAPITQRAHFVYDGTYPLTMVAVGGGSVSPPTGPYHVGDEVEIAATAPFGYIFDGWAGEGTGSYTGPDPVAAVTMSGPITQTATFHHVGLAQVTIQAFGNGFVSPPSGAYPREVGFTLFAWPAAGSTFYRWVGEGSGSYTGTSPGVTLVPDDSVIVQTAYFAEGGVYPVTVTSSEGGFVSPPSGQFVPGTQVELSATPASGHRLREWIGTGLGSYSGTDPFPTIAVHAPITQHAVFEPDGLPHGYEFSISVSPTDPHAVTDVPADGPRPLYLWLTCSELGLSALEAGVQSTIVLTDFTPAPGVVDVGFGSDLILAIEDCPTGASAARVLGSWTALDTGGRVWLERSAASGTFGTVDCGSLPAIWPDPYVTGFSSSGPAPITGSNRCDVVVSVVLTQLAAVPESRRVAVTWVTSSAVDHAGFHVYRSDAIEGPYARLTEGLLVGESPHRYEDRTVEGDRIYFYKVGAVDVNGHEDLLGPVRVTTPKWAPLVTALSGIAPNPFRGGTELRFSLAAPGRARLAVYDLAGRLVHVVQDGELPAGDHAVRWDGRTAAGQAAAGIYFVRFESGAKRETKRVAFLGGSR